MSSQARAQASNTDRASDVDLEFRLHLLVASNVAADAAKLPAQLEVVARDLRPLLPFTNYRLGATFLSRAKSGKSLSVKGVGRTLLVTPALEASVNPTFYEFSTGTISLRGDEAGREVVQLAPFRFGLRIPLQGTVSRGGDEGNGSVLYEPVGITTELTLREGEPTVVGTLDAGRPNETLVLVLIATRAGAR
ncbi:MAG: hypothetical protein JO360_06340 [Acidobacteria bacterium]|nr:hypothetical protein [Acidobacteriota bacterium]